MDVWRVPLWGVDQTFLRPRRTCYASTQPPRTVIRVTKEGSLMIDLILGIAILLGSGTVSRDPVGQWVQFQLQCRPWAARSRPI